MKTRFIEERDIFAEGEMKTRLVLVKGWNKFNFFSCLHKNKLISRMHVMLKFKSVKKIKKYEKHSQNIITYHFSRYN